MKKRTLIPAAALALLAVHAPAVDAAQEKDEFQNERRILEECGLEQKTFKAADGSLNYCQGFYNASEPGAPAILVFLHGVGERGEENLAQNRLAVPEIVRNIRANRRKVVLLAPQCPSSEFWAPLRRNGKAVGKDTHPGSALARIPALVREKIAEFRADPNRVYVTGLSMGGHGTWEIARRNPELFAAAIPICGGGDPAWAESLKNMPLRIYQGADDELVPATLSRAMHEALKKAGCVDVGYTEYAGVGHNSWDPAYEDPETLDWLFRQKKSEPAAR